MSFQLVLPAGMELAAALKSKVASAIVSSPSEVPLSNVFGADIGKYVKGVS